MPNDKYLSDPVIVRLFDSNKKEIKDLNIVEKKVETTLTIINSMNDKQKVKKSVEVKYSLIVDFVDTTTKNTEHREISYDDLNLCSEDFITLKHKKI